MLSPQFNTSPSTPEPPLELPASPGRENHAWIIIDGLACPSETPLPTGPPGDRATVAAAIEVLSGGGKRRGLARLLPFLGPAIIASVAYVDPGNFATNLQSGSQLGYTLLWVVMASNLMAMLIQTLSAKLGIATGRNLAEQCRLSLPRGLCFLLWGVMEIVAMATDLAEFLGAALGFHLLFGLPLGVAGILTAVVTFLLLSLERYGFRRLEVGHHLAGRGPRGFLSR